MSSVDKRASVCRLRFGWSPSLAVSTQSQRVPAGFFFLFQCATRKEKRRREKHSAVYADEFVVSIADELRGTDAHGSTYPTSSQVVVRVLGAMAHGSASEC